LKYFDI